MYGGSKHETLQNRMHNFDIKNPNFIRVAHRNGVILYRQVVMLPAWDREGSQIDTQQTPTHFEQDFCILKFWKCEVLATKNPEYLPQGY